MALPIRDGNQSLTTLSTILVSNAHIPAHTVVSLGTQAITDISTAVRNTAEGTVPTGGIPIMGYNGDNDTSFILRTNQGGQLVAEIASGTVTANGGDFTATDTTPTRAVQIGFTETDGSGDFVAVNNANRPFPVQVLSGTVTANVFGKDANSSATPQIPVISYDEGIAAANFGYVVPVQVTNVGGQISEANPLPISGTVTIGAGTAQIGSVTVGNSITIGASSVTFNSYVAKRDDGTWHPLSVEYGSGYISARVYPSDITPFRATVTIGNSVTIGSALPAGANQIGSVTASGTVTANLSNTVTASWKGASGSANAIPIVFAQEGAYGGGILAYDGSNTSLNVNIKGSLPSLVAGTAQIGSVTVGNTVTIANIQGNTTQTSVFTSTTPSSVIASAVTGRTVLTVFNEGAGNLHISIGAICTTIGYQVRLSAGDYWEAPLNQTSLLHSAVFATAGTARVAQVS